MSRNNRARRLLAVALALAALAAVAPASSLADPGGGPGPTRALSGRTPLAHGSPERGFRAAQAGCRSPSSARVLFAAARLPFCS